MFNKKPNIEGKLSLNEVNEICTAGSDTVEAQLIWANARIKGLEETIESFHLNHELAHYASMFLASSTANIIYDDDDNIKNHVRDNIDLAKLFIKEMENEK